MFKKSWHNFYGKLLYKIGQDFFDIQYIIRIIEINGQSVVAVPHERIVNLLATSVGEVSILSVCLSIPGFYVCLSVVLFLCQSLCPTVCLSVSLALCLSVCLSRSLSVCLFVPLSACLSDCLTFCHSLPSISPVCLLHGRSSFGFNQAFQGLILLRIRCY